MPKLAASRSTVSGRLVPSAVPNPPWSIPASCRIVLLKLSQKYCQLTPPALGYTPSAWASQELPSAEGGVQGATTAEATQPFLASDWAQHFLAQLETNQPGARRTFEKLFHVAPGTPIKEAMRRMRGLRHRLSEQAQP